MRWGSLDQTRPLGLCLAFPRACVQGFVLTLPPHGWACDQGLRAGPCWAEKRGHGAAVGAPSSSQVQLGA